jgi:hypothetical protein
MNTTRMGKLATFTHFAITANYWALGNGVDEAVAKLRAEAGRERIRNGGRAVYEFNRPVTVKDIRVSEVDGSLGVVEGVTVKPVEIIRGKK